MIATMTSARERIGKRDIAIATVLSALGLLLMYDNVWGSLAPEERVNNPDAQARIHVGNLVPYELAVPLFLLVTVPLLWRRVSPLAAVQASFAGLVVNDLLIGTEALRCGVILPTAFLLAFAAGSRLDARDARIALAFAVALVSLDLVVGFPVEMAVVASGLTAAIWGIGRVVQSRGRMAAELEARTADLRQARDERARMEVASARARLSRELDELLQRRLGELARMAEDGSRPDTAGSATAALAEIETTSRRTLEEMRSLVGLLRDDSSDAPTAPQPTLTHLEALLVRAKGADARLTVEGNPRVLPAGVELAAYRIVEHLLAAVDDSSDVNVRVRFADDALELAISGPARRDAKASFERARERVRMQSGTFEATTRRGRSEAVVSLPVLSAV